MRRVLCGLVGVLVPVSTAPGQQEAVVDNQRFAQSLVRAMQVHDRSVRSMEWDQVLLLAVGTPGETAVRTHQAWDETGRWACDDVVELRPDGVPVALRERTIFDGQWVRGYEQTQRGGTIQEDSGHRVRGTGIDAWFGRHVDMHCQKTLSEYLLEADDLRFAGFSAKGLPCVEATADLMLYVALVQVEIDPDHGFAPREIVLRDRAIRLPYYRFTVLDWAFESGVWLPRVGDFETRCFKPTAEQARKFGLALAAHGLSSRTSDCHTKVVQDAYLSVLREAFDADEAASVPLEPVMRCTATNIRVNVPIDEAIFQLEFPPDYLVLDVVRERLRKPHANAWIDNGPKPGKESPGD